MTCGALNCFRDRRRIVRSRRRDDDRARSGSACRETIRVTLTGERPPALAAKDVALTIVAELGADGANYQAIEFTGDAAAGVPLRRSAGAEQPDGRGRREGRDLSARPDDCVPRTAAASRHAGHADAGARYAREIVCDLATLTPRVARPHAPDNVVRASRTPPASPVQMVFIGTCTGGRVVDFHDALAAFERAGGRLAAGRAARAHARVARSARAARAPTARSRGSSRPARS